MHIVTGMLIAGLLRQKGRGSLVPLLRTGPVRTTHWLRGRVRFYVPSLVGATDQAEVLQSRLSQLDGVEQVGVNATSGSVLIGYREKIVQPELLFAATVRLLGLDKELERPPRPTVVRELRSMVGSLNRIVYDRTGGLLDFTSAVLILLAAMGVNKLIRQGGAAMPAGFTLLWWGAHQILGAGAEE